MKSTGLKKLGILLIVVIVVAAGLLFTRYFKDGKLIVIDTEKEAKKDDEGSKVVEIKNPETFKGTDRPIAVMIDNHKGAVPQANLDKAYIVYEIIVEGGETRLMALYKGQDLDKIGPVRSSRHYFLDYALENDAIYVHYGWSPQAQSDITKLGVNNINGISESSTSFWRVTDKYAPHNVATNTKKILEIAERKGYKTTSKATSLLNYVVDSVELKNSTQATKVTIPYSTSNTVVYEYDEDTKTYIRYSRGTKQVDWDTKETVTTKNIIVVKCQNTTLNDGENKGRQTLDNVKTLNGHYITEGKAIQITAEKTTRSGKTIYKDLEGNEIEVNDGNTFIQICPLDSNVTFEPQENITQE